MASREHPIGRPAEAARSLLTAGDPSPVAILNPAGASPFLLTADHAGRAIPRSLDRLGLAGSALDRHIAWDIGVAETGALLAARLDATFIHQPYSRLVIDCNRHPHAADSIPPMSDGTIVPGNATIDETQAAARRDAIHTPYHAAITAEIARRNEKRRRTIIVALHSFTPVMAGVSRPWDIGILHDGGDARFARRVLAALAADDGFVTGDNEPYHMDNTDFSVPHHAYGAGLSYVEVEFRQDHLATPEGRRLWADRFADALLDADRSGSGG